MIFTEEDAQGLWFMFSKFCPLLSKQGLTCPGGRIGLLGYGAGGGLTAWLILSFSKEMTVPRDISTFVFISKPCQNITIPQ